MAELRAFHGKRTIKAKYIQRVRRHAAADAVVQGRYWHEGKGCAVGCTIHGDEHRNYEIELGIPVWLAHLEDLLVEELSNGDAKRFPLAFLEAIPVGADLEPARLKFMSWLLEAGWLAIGQRGLSKLGMEVCGKLYTQLRAACETGALSTDAAWARARNNAPSKLRPYQHAPFDRDALYFLRWFALAGDGLVEDLSIAVTRYIDLACGTAATQERAAEVVEKLLELLRAAV